MRLIPAHQGATVGTVAGGAMIRSFFEALFAILKSGPAPKPPGIPTPGPTPDKLPTPVGKPAKLPPLNGTILRNGDDGPLVLALQRRLVEIGYTDLNVDGEFGEVTEQAVRKFQDARNLDPDGEVGDMTWGQLQRADAHIRLPDLLPPSIAKHGEPPAWYTEAEKDIGFQEKGNNHGLEKFIREAGYGANGWQWCKLFVGAKLKVAGYPSQASGMARSVETDPNFVKLSGPALGAIVPMYREPKSSGKGHIFFYDGESSLGIRGIGGNEDNRVKRSFHSRKHCLGYYWPKTAPRPTKIGPIQVNSAGQALNQNMS